jgi:hypothetical protein
MSKDNLKKSDNTKIINNDSKTVANGRLQSVGL